MNDDELHIRLDPEQSGRKQIVVCPYDWVTLRAPPNDCEQHQINIGAMVRNTLRRRGAIVCIGDVCAIYPCQRVREFAGLE
ncbi:MAG: hypothetical protein WC455_20115 [Dehalococcoidia bacterium]|jgi:hypothetical protein